MFLLAIIITVLPGCEDDDDPAIQTSQWDFEVNIEITDPDMYTYYSEGVAVLEATETAFAVEADFSFAGIGYTDVVVEGSVSGGNMVLSNKTVELVFQHEGNEYVKLVSFNIPEGVNANHQATGTGTITIERTDTGLVESGTLEFTAVKQ